VTHFGRITREGDPEMRRLLVQAAHACLLTKADSGLKSWARAIAERKGNGKTEVALARKPAVLMHHLRVTGEVCQALPNNRASQAT
jgi:transposase